MFMELHTPSEKKKPFRCKEVEGGEIIIYPSDKNGHPQAKDAYVITPFILDLVKSAIKNQKEIAIGASRDNPPTGSIGYALKKQGLTPQWSSYVVGYLIGQNYCHVSGSKPTRVR